MSNNVRNFSFNSKEQAIKATGDGCKNFAEKKEKNPSAEPMVKKAKEKGIKYKVSY